MNRILPSLNDSIFSVKCYIGAMLALYLSYSIGLPRPFWSVTTAYIVSQPWSGAVRSKAMYRLGGTFFGSAMVVYSVPRLANYPVLMILAMALWVGVCLYVSVLDRTPRSYMFMLAGYTAALIGFPSVTDPVNVFDTGLARVEEITLGILCASLAHSVILPQGIGRAIVGRLDATLRDARDWVRAVLHGDSAKQDNDRRQLANDLTQLRLMSAHVPFDTGNVRWTANALRVMQDRLAALTPSVSSVEDRLQALRDAGQPLPPAVAELLEQVSEWVGQGRKASARRAAELRHGLAALTPALTDSPDWHTLLQISLLTRVGELVDAFEACLLLRRDIGDGLQGSPRSVLRVRPLARGAVLHRDHGIALWSALSVGVAIAVCCTFWIGTAWTNGSVAAMMAVVFSCFFASQDNPVPGIMQFLKFTVYSIPLSAFYLLVVMPAVHSFEMLALTLFPVAFFLGTLISRPKYTLQGMALLFGVTGTLALHDTNTADVVSFLDSTVAQVLGVVTAALVAAIFRTASADWSARRIQTANWDELAELAGSPKARSSNEAYAYASRILDRVGLLQPRLAMATRRDDRLAADALKDLRVGKDIIELQRARAELPVADAAIQRVLRGLAVYFGRRASNRRDDMQLLEPIDRALAGVTATRGADPARSRAAVALVGIRRALYPQADGYAAPRVVPVPEPTP